MSRIERATTRIWAERGAMSTALLPLAWLHGAVARLLRGGGGVRPAPDARAAHGLPVVVVGNLAVGGTGKTPLVAALVEAFAVHGVRCAIVSRGYGGERQLLPVTLRADDSPGRVGDEPLMLARATGVPVCVCVHRDLAVEHVAARGDVDLVLSDDGLQHRAMARDVEICVIDAARGLGNGRLLPAGPLRETPGRLAFVDLVALRTDAVEGGPTAQARDSSPTSAALAARLDALAPEVARATFSVGLDVAVRLGTGQAVELERWRGRRVHAVAGIARPERFFAMLRARGLEVVEHPFPDHHRFASGDVDFGDACPVLVTSKDAVKLAALVPVPPGVIEVRARAVPGPELRDAVRAMARRLCPERCAGGDGTADDVPPPPGDDP